MTSPLITPQEFANLSTPVILFDCRFALSDTSMGEQAYQKDHIPGAHYLHLDRDLSSPITTHGGRHPLPDAEHFQATMQRYGVNHDSHVVVYDDQRFAFASRLWWLLRYFGHDNVQILDGGYSGWLAAGNPVSSEVVPASEGNFTAVPQPEMVVDYHNVKANLENDRRLLIDSREAPRYQGLEEPIDPVAGHIPGAANYPWPEVTDANGFAISPANLQHRFAAVPADRELVVYCGSGVTACVNLLALELAGVQGAKLYAGSWSDWCSYL